MKKNVLIFINDSLGELDWIQPFLSSYSKKYNFFVYLNLSGKSKVTKKEIFNAYFENDKNIIHLDANLYFPDFFLRIDSIINSILRRISLIHLPTFIIFSPS